jgi:hypothetical protein
MLIPMLELNKNHTSKSTPPPETSATTPTYKNDVYFVV